MKLNDNRSNAIDLSVPDGVLMAEDIGDNDMIPGDMLEEITASLKQHIEKVLIDDPTDSIPPSVCAVCITNSEQEKISDSLGAVCVGYKTVIYGGKGVSDAGAGHDVCANAGRIAASDGVKPVAALLIAESWMSTNPKMRPSEDPNRKEILIIGGMSITGKKTILSTYDITRDANNNIVLSNNKDIKEATEMTMSSVHAFFRSYAITYKELNPEFDRSF